MSMSSLTSAADHAIIYGLDTRKYPSGRRGSPAKGVAGLKPGEGSNPSFRATASGQSPLCSGVLFCLRQKRTPSARSLAPPFNPEPAYAGLRGCFFMGDFGAGFRWVRLSATGLLAGFARIALEGYEKSPGVGLLDQAWLGGALRFRKLSLVSLMSTAAKMRAKPHSSRRLSRS